MNSKRNRKKEGFLNVKLSTRSALGKAWKRKWVVVQQNTSSTGKSLLLELYQEKGAYHKTVTSLLLEAVVGVRRAHSRSHAHAVEITSAARTLLTVSADSETETQDWLAMFRQNLLPPPAKEIACPPGIPADFVRVSVIPSKDSEALGLEGDYLAHVSPTAINLYDTRTAQVAQEWDLRHLKKFMLISKCHPLDAEKIVHILPSKRSPKGEREFIFFSAKGKELVESIYERLSTAMTVKSRRSRSTSMLFEISPQELEQMLSQNEHPALEEKPQEADEAGQGTETDSQGVVNGDTSAVTPEPTPTAEDQAREQKEVTANGAANEGPTQPAENDQEVNEESEQAVEVMEETDKKAPEPNDSNGTAAGDGTSSTSIGQVADQSPQESARAEDEGTEPGQDESKANQTNPEEMDACTVDDPTRPDEANPAQPDPEPIELKGENDSPDQKDNSVSEEPPSQGEATSAVEQDDGTPPEENPSKEDGVPEEQPDQTETTSQEPRPPTEGEADAEEESPAKPDETTSEEQAVQDQASIPTHPDQEDGAPEVQPNEGDASTQEQPARDADKAPEEEEKEKEEEEEKEKEEEEKEKNDEVERPAQDGPALNEPSPVLDTEKTDAPDSSSGAIAAPDLPSETEQHPAMAGNPEDENENKDENEKSATVSTGPADARGESCGRSESPTLPTPSVPDTASEVEPSLDQARGPSTETSPSAEERQEVPT